MRKYFLSGCWMAYFYLPKKSLHLFPLRTAKCPPNLKKIYPFTYLELECQNATCFREKFLKKNKKICPPEVASKEF